ncbi:MAG: hypothetical protein GX819_02955 [Clostridiaceae bacterium]|nr:hypothetical protein [Clostridiaceae bacterium]
MRDHHELPPGLEPVSYYTRAIEAFCEMVAGGLKSLALSAPLEEPLASQVKILAAKSAAKYGLILYEEKEFPHTDLTPRDSVEGKTIFLFCRDAAVLVAYQSLKAEAEAGNNRSRELLRLLGYPPRTSPAKPGCPATCT